MISELDIRPIFADHLRPFSFAEGRRFSVPHFFLSLGLPLSVAVVYSFIHPVIAERFQANILTGFGIIAAILTGMLPVVQVVLGVAVPDRKDDVPFTEAEFGIWQRLTVRLEILRGLYAAICVAVILLVASVAPVMLLQFKSLPLWCEQAISVSIYFVALVVAVTFLQVVSGVYIVLDAYAQQLDQRLKDLAPRG